MGEYNCFDWLATTTHLITITFWHTRLITDSVSVLYCIILHINYNTAFVKNMLRQCIVFLETIKATEWIINGLLRDV